MWLLVVTTGIGMQLMHTIQSDMTVVPKIESPNRKLGREVGGCAVILIQAKAGVPTDA